VPLLPSLAFNLADFLEYLKKLLLGKTWGFSSFEYPQTVQRFIIEAFPHSFYRFLLIFLISFCLLAPFLLLKAKKKEMNKDYSELSFFLRMASKRIKKQALLAALPGQALLWSFFSPAIFLILLFLEAKFEIQGLGNLITTAHSWNDMPLLYGSLVCCILFTLLLLLFSVFFLFLRSVLLRK
jgi:ABC-type dipeptide/oligopeptide/nickel transport system permease component